MRVVLDTSILVSGLRSSLGASYRLLRMVDEGTLSPLASVALFIEYESVLKRPEQILAHEFSIAEIDTFLRGLAVKIEPVEVHFRWRPLLADPADELVLEAALNGNADCLVTHNTRDFDRVSQYFDIRIITPGTFLRELENNS